MNRDSLLNKTLSPPLSSRVPISHSNGIAYSNSSFSGGQMNEPSWIPSIRGSTHSVFILKFYLMLFVIFASARPLVGLEYWRSLARPHRLFGAFFSHSKKFLRLIDYK